MISEFTANFGELTRINRAITQHVLRISNPVEQNKRPSPDVVRELVQIPTIANSLFESYK